MPDHRCTACLHILLIPGLTACHHLLQSFCRKFVWHRECLWPEELPEPCLLVLAAEDDLVPSKLLRQLLQSINHPCEVGAHPSFSWCSQDLLTPGSPAWPDRCQCVVVKLRTFKIRMGNHVESV